MWPVKQFEKDPNSTLDYHINWGTWLAGDTISTSTWAVPTGLVKVSDSKTSTLTTIWLSGGTVGGGYSVVNAITSAAGRKEDATLLFTVRKK